MTTDYFLKYYFYFVSEDRTIHDFLLGSSTERVSFEHLQVLLHNIHSLSSCIVFQDDSIPKPLNTRGSFPCSEKTLIGQKVNFEFGNSVCILSKEIQTNIIGYIQASAHFKKEHSFNVRVNLLNTVHYYNNVNIAIYSSASPPVLMKHIT